MLKEYKYSFLLNPLTRYFAGTYGNTIGVNQLKRETPIVVSLSLSEGGSYENLELSLYSLLTQSVMPDRLILWMSDKYNLSDLPYSITRYIKNGLEIKFVQDLGAYTGTIHSLQQFEKSILVVADGTVYYPKDWLKKLYHSYISSQKDIHVHVAHRIRLDDARKKLIPFAEWEKHINIERPSYANFISLSGGILYPPNCFSKEVFRGDIYQKYNIDADIWFWFMGLLSGRKIRVVKNHINVIKSLDIINKLKINQEEQNKKKDRQIETLMEFYGQNILVKFM